MAVRKYTIDDLQVISDPVWAIRRFYSGHLGGAPGASYCAAALLQQLILLGATPARVERRGNWIFISSERDWLASSDSVPTKRPFFHVVPYPEGGQNSHRAEILLSAFAAAVVSVGSDGVQWIVSNADHHPLPDGSTVERFHAGEGRTVGFMFSEGEG
ncbi:MAG: hypothetical protein NTV97_27615 [Alphaproteobacteria bacterium]|nr:hypothetical protein [Alphaproteobacteria bacterium]